MINFPNCSDCKKELKGYRQKRCQSCAGKKRMQDISLKKPRLCKVCGKEFLKSWYSLKNWERASFCSSHCHNNQKIPKKCLTCGIIFVKKGEYSLKGWEVVKFCSEKCSDVGISGEKSVHWKDGATELYRAIRVSTQYIKWRKDVFSSCGTKCVFCGETKNLHVDHIKSLKDIIKENSIKTIIEARNTKCLWDINNGRVLCFDCHKLTDTYGVRNNMEAGVMALKSL